MALPSCRSNLHNSIFTVAASPPRCSLHRYQRLLPRYQRKQNGVRCSADRRELFTRIAPVYDNLNDLLSLGQHRIWKKMCVSWSGAKEGDIVLDICCGSGDLTFLLSQKVGSNGEVSALDFSRKQLFIASTRQDLFWKACYKNIKWIEDDALNLPFEDSYFNAVTVGFGLRNLVDKRKAMQEIFRVLKPGSKVSILDFNKSTSSWISQCQEWTLDNVVVPIASTYGLSEEYKYLKSSIAEFMTGPNLVHFILFVLFYSFDYCQGCRLAVKLCIY
ncbi:2-phytyl-1,4-beta-naphthoquinone methyltransferase, chloroplastic [Dendrobium catenatum]|uniref:2-phytyl-1,4-beta-naphthoquinone methyltransferase, chloroplastic n=1 Tax=Dendrobium catenatum TaxID=906689 RepID=UPI0010A05347|nr:2-phytyl-1,4-beta-naphthoquinone methyltransferase, chloroplastic [Dendrobium catenatum]